MRARWRAGTVTVCGVGRHAHIWPDDRGVTAADVGRIGVVGTGLAVGVENRTDKAVGVLDHLLRRDQRWDRDGPRNGGRGKRNFEKHSHNTTERNA